MKKKKALRQKIKQLKTKTNWLEKQIGYLWERAEKQRKIGFEAAQIEHDLKEAENNSALKANKATYIDIEEIFKNHVVISTNKPYLKYLFKKPDFLQTFPDIITPQGLFIMVKLDLLPPN